jgi:hypothetical protein
MESGQRGDKYYERVNGIIRINKKIVKEVKRIKYI